MKRAHLTIIVAAAVSLPVAAGAYLLNPGSYVASGTTTTFFVSNSLVTSMTFQPNVSPAAVVTTLDLVRAADRAAHTWPRMARINTAIAVSSSTSYVQSVERCPTVKNICWPSWGCEHGTLESSIAVRPRCNQGSNVRAQSYCAGNGSTNCDIIFFTNDTWQMDQDGLDSTGYNSSLNRWSEVLSHEFGHTFGLGDLSDVACDNSGDYAPLMCQGGSMGVGRRWQWLSPDEIDGAAGYFSRVSRPIGLTRVSTDTYGSMFVSANPLNANLATNSVAQPRISCQNTTLIPDCVMTTTDGSNVSLWAISDFGVDFASSAPGPITLPPSHRSTHEVDIAYGAIGGVPAHAVAAMLKYDGANTAAYGWAQWDLQQNTLSLGTFSSPAGRLAPRVTWHRGLSRYVVAMSQPDRRIAISISTNSAGTAWSAPVVIPTGDIGAPGTSTTQTYGQFDLSCPNHTSASVCQLVFHGSGSSAADRALQIRACQFEVALVGSTPTFYNMVCDISPISSQAVSTVTDVRVGETGSIPGWFYSGAQSFPTESANTAMYLSVSSIPAFRTYLNGAGVPTPVTANIATQSRWGGTGCDFEEWSNDIICAELRGSVSW